MSRGRLARPSPPTQRRLALAMQAGLVGLVGYGFVAGQPKAVVNGSVAFAVTLLPALFERRYDLPLDPWLGLWIASAVLLHTLGSAGLYGRVGWWDHLTHATSASLVAGVGYTAVRAVDLHASDVHVPRRFAFAYILSVVLAFGVFWELFEHALDLASAATGLTMPLAQHGLDDTVRDLLYNSLGAVVVATFGQAHLGGVAEAVRDRWFPARRP